MILTILSLDKVAERYVRTYMYHYGLYVHICHIIFIHIIWALNIKVCISNVKIYLAKKFSKTYVDDHHYLVHHSL